MTPVDQDRFYVEGVSRGNCQQAATASLLDLSLAEVPNFVEAEFFWQSYMDFLKSRGFADLLVPNYRTPPDSMFYLAYGPAPRGVRHAVVMTEGRLAHDPHPSRAGLNKVEEIHIVVPLAELGRWRRWVATGDLRSSEGAKS